MYFYIINRSTPLQSEDIRVNLFIPITLVQISLIWTDEADDYPRQNQADCFSVTASCSSNENSGYYCNEPDGSGEIIIELDPALFFIEDVQITVTLEYTGDQTGPMGIPFGPQVVEDNENSYMIIVNIERLLIEE